MSTQTVFRPISVIGIAISIGALVWLFSQFDFTEVVAAFGAARLWALVPVAALIVGDFLLRAWRWQVLFGSQNRVRLRHAFRALSVGYLFNNIMPARAGDFIRALELGRLQDISRTRAFTTIVVERTGELLFLLALLSAVLLSYPALPAWLGRAGIGVSVITMAALVVLIVAHLKAPALVLFVERAFIRVGAARFVPTAVRIANSFAAGASGLFTVAGAAVFFSLTTVLWGVEVWILHVVAHAFGLDIAPGNLLFVLLVIALGTMVPSSPGFVGTYEFFGVSALAIVGITGPIALSFIITLHAAMLVGTSLLGAGALWIRRTSSGDAGEVGEHR